MTKLHLIYLYTIIVYQLTGSQSSVIPPDGSPPDTCNACCQGPAGLPGIPGTAGAAGAAGIPGSPGNIGLPGRDGMKGEAGIKGDMGEHGERGEQGISGSPGPQGDLGKRGPQGLRGAPGKVGPQGIPGLVGSDGRPGPSGEKGEKGALGPHGLTGMKGADGRAGPSGEKGEKGEAGSQRRSAFSVAKTGYQTGYPGDTLTFEDIETNIGNHYSSTTHRFTCQIPGTYVFMFTIASYSSSNDPYVDLMKDGNYIARAIVRETDSGGSMFLQSSQSVVLQLTAGNQVWLQFVSSGEAVFSNSYKYTTFAGFLLYED